MTLEELIRMYVLKIVKESKTGAEAARRLGICIRSLRNYLHSYGAFKKDAVYDCMENITPKERDWFESLDKLDWNKKWKK